MTEMTQDDRMSAGGGHAARTSRFQLAAIALLALSTFLMIGPLFLDTFACTSFVGMPSLNPFGPHPMWVRPVTCAFGSVMTFLDIGFVGLVVSTAWAAHAWQRRLTAVGLTLTLAGAAWLLYAIGGPDMVRRIVIHLARML